MGITYLNKNAQGGTQSQTSKLFGNRFGFGISRIPRNWKVFKNTYNMSSLVENSSSSSQGEAEEPKATSADSENNHSKKERKPPATSSKRNTHSDFVGIPGLKSKHELQIRQFRRWARSKNWGEFHHNHYDWWAFPIADRSSHGTAYSVYDWEVDALKEDTEFMSNFKDGLKLLAESWGKRHSLPTSTLQ